MGNPSISVILPAFNCVKYIRQAVQSILDQSYTDFELLIIEDGSTDGTLEVLKEINDPRIRLEANASNSGLVYSLNKGIDLARGEYIARMDGDDISDPSRLLLQRDYLDLHPATGFVTSTAMLIDEQGQDLGTWKDDVDHISYASIRRFLPKNNCLVHPAMMGRTTLFRKYRFSVWQSQAEDYDLWLRVVADGVRIDKLEMPLIRHRIIQQSFTRKRQRNVFYKNASTKLRFARRTISSGKLNRFVLRVGVYGLLDLVLGTGKIIKSKLSS